jgi:hypothetical protein
VLRGLFRSASVAALVTAGARGAHAQPADDARELGAAQAIFDRAIELMDQGKYDEACPRFQDVVRLVPAGLGAKLRVAECHERAGQLATAWSKYVLAENAAVAAGQQERAAFARERAAALKPKLSRLVIRVPDALRATEGLTVQRDGAAVTSAEWGLPVPVDAGTHTVVVRAPKKTPWETSLVVAGDAAEAIVTAPEALAPASEQRPVGATRREPAPVATGGVPTYAWIIGGVGIALGSVSVGFAVDQSAAQREIHAHCSASACDRAGGFNPRSANDRLYRDYGLFIGFGIAGALALGMSVVTVVTAPPRRKPAPAGGTPWIARF